MKTAKEGLMKTHQDKNHNGKTNSTFFLIIQKFLQFMKMFLPFFK
jgi:hypothetical protein